MGAVTCCGEIGLHWEARFQTGVDPNGARLLRGDLKTTCWAVCLPQDRVRRLLPGHERDGLVPFE